jgi:MoaA/NifB/PqqE/SkfB family radical SAM enzyme
MKDMQKMGILEHVYVAFCFLRFVSQYEAENHNRHFKEFFQMTESSCVDTQKEEIDTNTLIKELEMLFEYFPKKYHHYYFNPSPLSKKDIHRWFATDEFLYPDVTCHVPWTHCQILYNGDVIVNGRCCSPVFGNIYKQNFREIWNSETARHFRKTLLLNKNFPVCNRCSRKFNVQMLS